jgi:hypothetical protein
VRYVRCEVLTIQEQTYMKIRLFRLAQKRWKLSFRDCGRLFAEYHVYDLVDELYEEFHVQGDGANLDEIEDILRARGAHI